MDAKRPELEGVNLVETTTTIEVPRFDRKAATPLVRDLHALEQHRDPFWIAVAWAVIVATVVLAERIGPWATVPAIVIVASRQHALLVLMHEACHRTMFKNRKLGVLVANVFTSLPVGVDTRIFAEHHLKHHLHLNTREDPDFALKQRKAEQWTFPMTWRRFFAAYRGYLLLGGVIEWVGAFLYFSGLWRLVRQRGDRDASGFLLKVVYWLALFGPLVYAGYGVLLLKYWAAPFFLVLPYLIRVRSVSEHFALACDHELTSARNVFAPAVEAFLFGPHEICVHLTHHLYPAIPWYNLREAHRRLLAIDAYREMARVNDSYLWPTRTSVLGDLLETSRDPR